MVFKIGHPFLAVCSTGSLSWFLLFPPWLLGLFNFPPRLGVHAGKFSPRSQEENNTKSTKAYSPLPIHMGVVTLYYTEYCIAWSYWSEIYLKPVTNDNHIEFKNIGSKANKQKGFFHRVRCYTKLNHFPIKSLYCLKANLHSFCGEDLTSWERWQINLFIKDTTSAW